MSKIWGGRGSLMSSSRLINKRQSVYSYTHKGSWLKSRIWSLRKGLYDCIGTPFASLLSLASTSQ